MNECSAMEGGGFWGGGGGGRDKGDPPVFYAEDMQ